MVKSPGSFEDRATLGAILRGLMILTLVWALTVRGQVGSREYQLKAVFLSRFAQFTDWPEGAFASADSPLIIGILGQDPFGDSLELAVRNERVHNHRLTVERFARSQDAKVCHLLFISRSEATRLQKCLAEVKDRSILTVGETEDFVFRGGMIQFVTEQNRIHFRINLTAAREANLRISSKLLELAEVVNVKRQ